MLTNTTSTKIFKSIADLNPEEGLCLSSGQTVDKVVFWRKGSENKEFSESCSGEAACTPKPGTTAFRPQRGLREKAVVHSTSNRGGVAWATPPRQNQDFGEITVRRNGAKAPFPRYGGNEFPRNERSLRR